MKIILAIMIFCTIIYADRDGGPYLGFGYGISKYDDDNIFKEQKIDDSNSLIVYGGAYINKYLSVELAYVNFNHEHPYIVIDTTSIQKNISFSSLSVSTLVHYPFFDDVLDIYGKFGVGQLSASGTNANGFTMLYGGGVGVRFTDMLSLRVAYDIYNIEYNKADNSKHGMNLDVAYVLFEVQF